MPPIVPYRPRPLEEVLDDQDDQKKRDKMDKVKKEKKLKDKESRGRLQKPIREKIDNVAGIKQGSYKVRNQIFNVIRRLTTYDEFRQEYKHLYTSIRPIKQQMSTMAKDFKELQYRSR